MGKRFESGTSHKMSKWPSNVQKGVQLHHSSGKYDMIPLTPTRVGKMKKTIPRVCENVE